MRKKFTFSSRADVYFLAIMVNCLERKCRITLVYLKFQFVPWNEKKKKKKKKKKSRKNNKKKIYIKIKKN